MKKYNGKENYGRELILDVHDCDVARFTQERIEKYLAHLCDEILEMTRRELYFWSETTANPQTSGISAVQFIMTSSITVHALDQLGNIHVNIFSCKAFPVHSASAYTVDFFKGTLVSFRDIKRL